MKSCSVSDGLAIFKALGSPVRVQILRLIQEREGLNIKQIAQNLKIPVTTPMWSIYRQLKENRQILS